MSANLLLNSYSIERSLPENYVKGELDFCAKEFSYKTQNVELLEVDDCFVSDKGFVYQGYFTINESSLLDPKRYTDYFTLKHFVKKVLFRKKRKTDPQKKYLLVFDEWSGGYYHWFCDVLPRIYVLKDSIKNYCLLLPNNSSLGQIFLESLKILEITPKEIVFIDGRELLKIKNLSIVTHTCTPGYINDTLMQGVRDLFYEKLSLTKNTGNERKIYISREKARFRKILNEQEVQSVMKKFNYEIIHYEDMCLQEQIEITSSAKFMVSLHGAGLTNVLFLPPNSSVLEFRRDKIYHNQCYWHLTGSLNHKYYYLFGKPDNEDLVIEGEGCNISIDINKLIKILNQMEEQS